MYSDRRGTDKNHPEQNLPDKRPLEKTPRTIEREFVQRVFVRVFCTKKGGPRCVTFLWGVSGCVTKCDRRRGSKLAKNSVTYFMDCPLCALRVILIPLQILTTKMTHKDTTRLRYFL